MEQECDACCFKRDLDRACFSGEEIEEGCQVLDVCTRCAVMESPCHRENYGTRTNLQSEHHTLKRARGCGTLQCYQPVAQARRCTTPSVRYPPSPSQADDSRTAHRRPKIQNRIPRIRQSLHYAFVDEKRCAAKYIEQENERSIFGEVSVPSDDNANGFFNINFKSAGNGADLLTTREASTCSCLLYTSDAADE